MPDKIRAHWHNHESEQLPNPRVDAFLDEIEQVCRKHGMSISHEDSQGSFIVREELDESDLRWLHAASVDTKR